MTVAVTPNGYADAIKGDKFVMPEEREMTVNTFLDVLLGSQRESSNGVFYIQKQNSNLVDEFSSVMEDVKPFDWAGKAFGEIQATYLISFLDTSNLNIPGSLRGGSLHAAHTCLVYIV